MSSGRYQSGVRAYQQASAGVQDGLQDKPAVLKQYERRIYHIAHRLAGKIPPDANLDFEDLVSYGVLGLFEAMERFESARGNQFSTFADYRIRGAMIDAIRSMDTLSRHSREQAKTVKETAELLNERYDRRPTQTEIAEHLGLEIEEVQRREVLAQKVIHSSFDLDSDDPDGRNLAEVIADEQNVSALDVLLNSEFRDQIKGAISSLPERKQQCILLYYGRNLNLQEIAGIFDITASRVSQILSQARDELRQTLREVASTHGFAGSDSTED